MKAETIKSVLDNPRTAPLTVTVSDGRRFVVQHPDYVHLLKSGLLIIENEQNILVMLDTDQITSLEFATLTA